MSRVPHLRVVVAVSAFVLIGFGAISVFTLGWTDDEVTKGNVIGTWLNFAMLVIGFWIGSSSGGKASKSDEVQAVEVQNAPSNPIPTTDIPEPQFGKVE